MWVMNPMTMTCLLPAASTRSPRSVPTKALGAVLTTTGSSASGATAGRNRPVGTIRITAPEDAIWLVLMPRLKNFFLKYPDIKVELFADSAFVDLATANFDAGVRLGESVAQDMIATRVGPDLQLAVVATKRHFNAASMQHTQATCALQLHQHALEDARRLVGLGVRER